MNLHPNSSRPTPFSRISSASGIEQRKKTNIGRPCMCLFYFHHCVDRSSSPYCPFPVEMSRYTTQIAVTADSAPQRPVHIYIYIYIVLIPKLKSKVILPQNLIYTRVYISFLAWWLSSYKIISTSSNPGLRLPAFHFTLMPFGKVWTHLLSFYLKVNSRTN